MENEEKKIELTEAELAALLKEAREKTLIELTRLWKGTTKDGKEYFSGYLGSSRVVILENEFFEEGSKRPTHRVYVTRPKPKPAAAEHPEKPAVEAKTESTAAA